MLGGFVYGQGRKSDVYCVDLRNLVSDSACRYYRNMVYMSVDQIHDKLDFVPLNGFYQFIKRDDLLI